MQGASGRGRTRVPQECYLPVTVLIHPAALGENLQLLQQIPSQQQAQNKHIYLGFIHSLACETAEAQMETGRSVCGCQGPVGPRRPSQSVSLEEKYPVRVPKLTLRIPIPEA